MRIRVRTLLILVALSALLIRVVGQEPSIAGEEARPLDRIAQG
ncbi:MAG TPA: hypothetical protein VG406_17500 [Isosphaeraceae bacterium]|jgi:hypothetical protein|nr:hypothetical protein [Isosphaeraceae bacterium]